MPYISLSSQSRAKRLKSATMTGLLCSIGLLGALMGPIPGATAEDGLDKIVTEGKVKLNIRYRFEFVNDDLTPLDASASTIRTRLGFLSGEFKGLQAFVEMENTSSLFGERFNAPGPNGPKRPGRAIVADPEFTELNQAWAQFKGPGDTVIRGGRQRLILDNARFIGNVGWRQNEQTFDAITLKSGIIPKTTLFYGYLFNANTILGTNREMNSHLINAAFNGLPFGKLTAYAYLLDFDPGAGLDSSTIGARFAGSQDTGAGFKLLYTLEYASQSDYKDAASFNADYFLIELGGAFKGITIKGGYEVLGSDGGAAAFQMPLATLHAFQGWADRFLATPATGIEDIYGLVSAKFAGITFLAIYHDFSSEDGAVDYGTEIDLRATRKFGKYLSAGAKFSHYNAANPGAGGVNNDVDKLWLWLGFNY